MKYVVRLDSSDAWTDVIRVQSTSTQDLLLEALTRLWRQYGEYRREELPILAAEVAESIKAVNVALDKVQVHE